MVKRTAMAAAVLAASVAWAQQREQRPHEQVSQQMLHLLSMLHQENQEQIQLGTLAREKASANDVKQLGRLLAQDHQRADEQLAKLTQRLNLELPPFEPRTDVERSIAASHEAEMKKLQALEGEQFDRAFLSAQVGMHDLEIAQLRQARSETENREIQRFIDEQLPMLERHRAQAYRLLGEAPRRARRPPAE